MSAIECDEENWQTYAASSLQVFVKLGTDRLYLYTCDACGHPSVHEHKGAEQFCPCCSELLPATKPSKALAGPGLPSPS